MSFVRNTSRRITKFRLSQKLSSSAHKTSKGQTILIVIFVTIFISLIIGLLIGEYIFKIRTLQYQIEKAKVYYMAESGIKKAIYKVIKNKDFRTGDLLKDSTVSESLFWNRPELAKISVVDFGGYLRVTSQVKGRRAYKAIEALVGAKLPGTSIITLSSFLGSR